MRMSLSRDPSNSWWEAGLEGVVLVYTEEKASARLSHISFASSDNSPFASVMGQLLAGLLSSFGCKHVGWVFPELMNQTLLICSLGSNSKVSISKPDVDQIAPVIVARPRLESISYG